MRPVTGALALAASLLAGGAAVATAVAPRAVAPVVVHDPRDAPPGRLDLTRAQLGVAADGRLRAALTLSRPWTARDLLAPAAHPTPPGSVCLRLWTASSPGAAPPDHLVCISARNADELRGTVMGRDEDGRLRRIASATVGRTSERSATVRFAPSAVGRPRTIRFAGDVTTPGCPRPSCVDSAPDAPSTGLLRLR